VTTNVADATLTSALDGVLRPAALAVPERGYAVDAAVEHLVVPDEACALTEPFPVGWMLLLPQAERLACEPRVPISAARASTVDDHGVAWLVPEVE
jgi:hypothetical protein